MDAERFAYENIEIPDDRLVQAIYAGMGRAERIRRKKRLSASLTAAAAAFALLFCSANIPAVYAYASGLPVVGEFVRALHIGGGGETTLHEDISVEVVDSELIVRFVNQGRTTDTVVPYRVQGHDAPCRIDLSLKSLTEEEYEKLEAQIREMKGVSDVYRTLSLEKDTVSFTIVLNRLYDYEVMEQIFPGTLSVRLFQDAYYTAEENAPEQQVYYLRTEGMEQDDSLRALLEKYKAEEPSQVRTQEGSFILAIGEFDTREEAEKRLLELQESYAGAAELQVGSGMAKETPQS